MIAATVARSIDEVYAGRGANSKHCQSSTKTRTKKIELQKGILTKVAPTGINKVNRQ